MTKDEIYYNSFIFCLFKITASVRYIFMDIDYDKKLITINAYYHKEPTELEKELMDDIGSNIMGIIDEPFDYSISTITTMEPFEKLNKGEYILYGRF